MSQHSRSTRLIRLIQIFGIFVLPVLLMYFGIIPVGARGWILFILTVLLIIIAILEKWSLKTVGLRVDNLKRAVFPYLIFTLAGLFVVIALAKLLGKQPVYHWWEEKHFLGGFIILSVLQELAFRGFLIPRLQSIFTSGLVVIMINALLFAFVHIIYPHPVQLFPLGFAGGLVFATLYYYFPNLLLVSISHTVLNFSVVYYCFFSFNTSC